MPHLSFSFAIKLYPPRSLLEYLCFKHLCIFGDSRSSGLKCWGGCGLWEFRIEFGLEVLRPAYKMPL